MTWIESIRRAVSMPDDNLHELDSDIISDILVPLINLWEKHTSDAGSDSFYVTAQLLVQVTRLLQQLVVKGNLDGNLDDVNKVMRCYIDSVFSDDDLPDMRSRLQ